MERADQLDPGLRAHIEGQQINPERVSTRHS
jgi:hypothetical protein